VIYRDQLEAVYKLIEDPNRWAQGNYALDAGGDPICNEDGEEIDDLAVADRDEAACWCIWGAAYKCGIRNRAAEDAFVGALGFTMSNEPNDFNDTHTHAEVLELLRQAIERAPVREVQS
jgi:hypothetical protein